MTQIEVHWWADKVLIFPVLFFLPQLSAPAEPLAALRRSMMTRWHSCLYRPDQTASAPSSPSRCLPSRGASLRRRPGDRGQSAAATKTTKMGPRPTVIWRRGNPCLSSTGTSLPPWCQLLWRTLTPTTAIRRSFFYIFKANICETWLNTSKKRLTLTWRHSKLPVIMSLAFNYSMTQTSQVCAFLFKLCSEKKLEAIYPVASTNLWKKKIQEVEVKVILKSCWRSRTAQFMRFFFARSSNYMNRYKDI